MDTAEKVPLKGRVRLEVTVVEATNIVSDLQQINPFIKLYLKSNTKKFFITETKENTVSPQWNETFTFETEDIDKDSLIILMKSEADTENKDKEANGSKKGDRSGENLIDKCKIKISAFNEGEINKVNKKTHLNDKKTGKLSLSIQGFNIKNDDNEKKEDEGENKGENEDNNEKENVGEKENHVENINEKESHVESIVEINEVKDEKKEEKEPKKGKKKDDKKKKGNKKKEDENKEDEKKEDEKKEDTKKKDEEKKKDEKKDNKKKGNKKEDNKKEDNKKEDNKKEDTKKKDDKKKDTKKRDDKKKGKKEGIVIEEREVKLEENNDENKEDGSKLSQENKKDKKKDRKKGKDNKDDKDNKDKKEKKKEEKKKDSSENKDLDPFPQSHLSKKQLKASKSIDSQLQISQSKPLNSSNEDFSYLKKNELKDKVKVHVTVIKAVGLEANENCKTLNPYVILNVGSVPNRFFKTEYKVGTANPEWNEDFSFIIENINTDFITFQMKSHSEEDDEESVNVKLISKFRVRIISLENSEEKILEKELKLEGKPVGSLFLKFKCSNYTSKPELKQIESVCVMPKLKDFDPSNLNGPNTLLYQGDKLSTTSHSSILASVEDEKSEDNIGAHTPLAEKSKKNNRKLTLQPEYVDNELDSKHKRKFSLPSSDNKNSKNIANGNFHLVCQLAEGDNLPGQCDIYATFHILKMPSSNTAASNTKKGPNPYWNEKCEFDCNSDDILVLSIYDKTNAVCIAENSIRLDDLNYDSPKKVETKVGLKGKVTVFFYAEKPNSPAVKFAEIPPPSSPSSSKLKKSRLHIKLVSGAGFQVYNNYVSFRLKTSESNNSNSLTYYKSETKQESDPTWNEEFDFLCQNTSKDSVIVNLHGGLSLSKQKPIMEEKVFKVSQFKIGDKPFIWEETVSLKKKKAGKLKIIFQAFDPYKQFTNSEDTNETPDLMTKSNEKESKEEKKEISRSATVAVKKAPILFKEPPKPVGPQTLVSNIPTTPVKDNTPLNITVHVIQITDCEAKAPIATVFMKDRDYSQFSTKPAKDGGKWDSKFHLHTDAPLTDIIVLQIREDESRIADDLEFPCRIYGQKAIFAEDIKYKGEKVGHLEVEFDIKSQISASPSFGSQPSTPTKSPQHRQYTIASTKSDQKRKDDFLISLKGIKLRVTVVDGKAVKDGKYSVLLRMKNNDKKDFVTTKYRKGTDLVWNEEFFIISKDSSKDTLRIVLQNNDKDCIDEVLLKTAEYKIGQQPIVWDNDVFKKKKKIGHLKFIIEPVDVEDTKPKQQLSPYNLNITLIDGQGFKNDNVTVEVSINDQNMVKSEESVNSEWNQEIMLPFTDPDKDTLTIKCSEGEKITIPLNTMSVGSINEYDEDVPGTKASIHFTLQPNERAKPRPEIAREKKQLSFSLGSYDSIYSTSFDSLSSDFNTSISSLDSSEFRLHRHRKDETDENMKDKPRRYDHVKGSLKSLDGIVPIEDAITYVTLDLFSICNGLKRDTIESKKSKKNSKMPDEFVFDLKKIKKGDTLRFGVWKTSEKVGTMKVGEINMKVKDLIDGENNVEIKVDKPVDFSYGNYSNFGSAVFVVDHSVEYSLD